MQIGAKQGLWFEMNASPYNTMMKPYTPSNLIMSLRTFNGKFFSFVL